MKRRAANSRIGRLSRELRELVNRMLGEARPAAEIVARLHDLGRTELTEGNVESWRESGYLDHLDQLERMHQIRLRSEASLEMVKAVTQDGRMPISEANDLLLASLVAQTLESFDPDSLREALAEDPKKFFNLASTVIGQAAERAKREKLELQFAKFRDQVDERRRRLEASLQEASRTGGITAETLEKIQEQLKLL
jgi:hypothetical protein